MLVHHRPRILTIASEARRGTRTMNADSPDLRLELTYDDEQIVHCEACRQRDRGKNLACLPLQLGCPIGEPEGGETCCCSQQQPSGDVGGRVPASDDQHGSYGC